MPCFGGKLKPVCLINLFRSKTLLNKDFKCSELKILINLNYALCLCLIWLVVFEILSWQTRWLVDITQGGTFLVVEAVVQSRGWHGSEFSNLSRPTPTKINLFPSQSHKKLGENPVPSTPGRMTPIPSHSRVGFFFLRRNLSVTVKI